MIVRPIARVVEVMPYEMDHRTPSKLTISRSTAERSDETESKTRLSPRAPSEVLLSSSISVANEWLRGQSLGIVFELRHEANQLVVYLLDIDSGQVVRQYSSQAILNAVTSLNMMTGYLLNDAV